MVPSEFAQNTIIKNFDGSKINFLPYGVNLSLFKSKKIKDTKFRIIYTGMLSLERE